MAMQKIRLAEQSLFFKVQEVLSNVGFTDANSTLMIGYPNATQADKITKWPTITLEFDNYRGVPIEIGSKPWATMEFYIDVLAASNGQKEDLSSIIWENLNESYVDLYDFNAGFPTSVGNYAGITKIGHIYLSDLSINSIAPDPYTNIVGEDFHNMIIGTINFSN